MVQSELQEDQQGCREGRKLDQGLAFRDECERYRGDAEEREQGDADRFQGGGLPPDAEWRRTTGLTGNRAVVERLQAGVD